MSTGSCLEIPASRSFSAPFQLPLSIDRDKIAADFSKGVLTITLPKTAEAQKPETKIEVKSS
jgi:HSP20 family protein